MLALVFKDTRLMKCMYDVRITGDWADTDGQGIAPFKGSAAEEWRREVSERRLFFFFFLNQPSLVFIIELVKMEKQKQNETVSGFALAASRFFFKESKHVFKNSLNNCAHVFNCDELRGFLDSGRDLSRKWSSLPGGRLRRSELLFLMSFCNTGQPFFPLLPR